MLTSENILYFSLRTSTEGQPYSRCEDGRQHRMLTCGYSRDHGHALLKLFLTSIMLNYQARWRLHAGIISFVKHCCEMPLHLCVRCYRTITNPAHNVSTHHCVKQHKKTRATCVLLYVRTSMIILKCSRHPTACCTAQKEHLFQHVLLYSCR